MVEPRQEAGTLGFDDGNGETTTELIEDEATLTIGDWATLHLSNVGCFGCNKAFEEFMEVLRDFSVLACDKAKEISKALKTFLERAYMIWSGVAILLVNVLGFVQV